MLSLRHVIRRIVPARQSATPSRPSAADEASDIYRRARELVANWPLEMATAFIANMPAYADHRTAGERTRAHEAHRQYGQLVGDCWSVATRGREPARAAKLQQVAVNLLINPSTKAHVHKAFVSALADLDAEVGETLTLHPASATKASAGATWNRAVQIVAGEEIARLARTSRAPGPGWWPGEFPWEEHVPIGGENRQATPSRPRAVA